MFGHKARIRSHLLDDRRLVEVLRKKKADEVGIAKSLIFRTIFGDASVARNHGPLPLPAQLANPFDVRRIAFEFFSESHNVMRTLEQFAQCAGHRRGHVVVKKDLHAASRDFS
jgi:hypothetical protein